MNIELFTAKQKDTYALVNSLSRKIEEVAKSGMFILNPEIAQYQHDIENAQIQCEHIWEEGVCIVCQKIQDHE